MVIKKKHILYTIPNFDTAGSGKVVYDLANQLDKKKFEVSILCKHDRGAFFKEVESLNVPIYLMDIVVPLRPYYTLIQRVNPFKKFLKDKNIDIVHSWNWSSDWSEVLACKIARTKFVYTKKSMGWGNVHWKIRTYLSNFIITVNLDMHQFFSYKKRQKLIPFGLDTTYYDPALFNNIKKDTTFKIITVANLVAVKNIELLLYALSSLGKLSIKLDIVGDTRNSYVDVLKQLVTDLKLESKVAFLGKQMDVRPFLAASHLYVIPSKKEGMPMALVEAMAMAIPVLGSDISGIRYVLQDYEELLFESSSSDELASKIEFLYKQDFKERQALGNTLRAYCLKRFSMKSFIDAHESLYLGL